MLLLLPFGLCGLGHFGRGVGGGIMGTLALVLTDGRRMGTNETTSREVSETELDREGNFGLTCVRPYETRGQGQ